MSNAYGFMAPGTQPAPNAQAVGQQLLQRRQQAPQGPGGAPMGQPMGGQPTEPQMSPSAQSEMLRREGGKLMGSGGDDSDSAFSQAVGEALTRAGGGHTPNPNPHKDRERGKRQLMQLGISEFEAGLLGETL